MKFRLVETLLTEGKNIDRTWEQYGDRIFSKMMELSPEKITKRMSDLPFVGDGQEEVPEEERMDLAKELWKQSILSIDPTYTKGSNTTGDCGIWLTNQFLQGRITHWSDSDYYKRILKDFCKKKSNLEIKDINHYKNAEELKKALDKVQFTPKQIERHRKNAYDDAKWVWGDDSWDVYTPTSYAGSVTLGKGTNWCTATSGNDSYYTDYTNDGTLYVIINRQFPGEKYQLYVPNDDAIKHVTASFLDKHDGNMHGVRYSEIDRNEFANLPDVTDGLVDFLSPMWNKVATKNEGRREVLAVMEAFGCTQEEAEAKLTPDENGNTDIYVNTDITTYEQYGRYVYEEFGNELLSIYHPFYYPDLGEWLWNNKTIEELSELTGHNERELRDMFFNDIAIEYINHCEQDRYGDYDDVPDQCIDFASLGYDEAQRDYVELTDYGLVEWG